MIKKNILILVLITIVLSGCSKDHFRNRFDTYYGSYASNERQNIPTLVLPKLIETNDINKKVADYKNRNYVVLGDSKFDGEWEARTKAIDLANKIGASIIIIQSKEISDISHRYSISVPTSNTSYHSGSVSTGISYTGTSTTHGSLEIQGEYTVREYRQKAVFMIKGKLGNVTN
ncbi:hypothetical protein BJAS_P4099 [Bathymodiolus japonicus methanotrophic gill symbiont]|uniref:hypothetical protein n=1 Tax=Bathymodiolus japonicus methanotrophic gill symbiont TaxID=113269 RepID=UPI001B438D8E|nr:hypothetical protein [Bathymodiolus japonicus methanotrophic gill symbiont]GFO73342.1 hypothetical protein BJAS_P4099 [Bathymodiolus japonicus methanotrophic gill symbiont]